MGKRLIMFLVFAMLVGMTCAAYAETQNIKVSGDITAYSVIRDQFRLQQAYEQNDNECHFSTITRLRVDADLTDNVLATVRLINERVWGEEYDSDYSTSGESTVSADGEDTDVHIDLAYITLKEFFYSPLTLTIGRQELHFGSEMIVGDVDSNNAVSAASGIFDQDLSKRKAFDAVRATLDYDPLIIDVIYAKISEQTINNPNQPEDDDIDLWGMNARYDFGGNWNALGEFYYFGKKARSHHAIGAQEKADVVHTIGARTVLTPIERLLVALEGAMQFGKTSTNNVGTTGSHELRKHDAWAASAYAQYALDMKYDPLLAISYAFFSGDKDSTNVDSSNAWDNMYENQTTGHIINVLFESANCHILKLSGSLTPIEDLRVTLDYVWVNLAKSMNGQTLTTTVPGSTAGHTMQNDKMHLGDEIDLTLVYDYTEDVQLGLIAGAFFPGSAFDSVCRKTATEIIGSVTVEF